jgi:hypothetical protein
MRRLRTALLVVLLVLAGAYGWWQFATRYVPAGQPPLATVDPSSIAALREDFNRASADTRVIVLLSPT